MWSHLTDLALKAQKDLEEQAHVAAQALQHTAPPVVSMSSFFNLDAMQQPSADQKTSVIAEADETPVVVAPSNKNDFCSPTKNAPENASIPAPNMPQEQSSSIHEEISNSPMNETLSMPAGNAETLEPPTNAVANPPLHIAEEVAIAPTEMGTPDVIPSEQTEVALEPPSVIVEEEDAPLMPSTVVADDDDDSSYSSVYPSEPDLVSRDTNAALVTSPLNDALDALSRSEVRVDANGAESSEADTSLQVILVEEVTAEFDPAKETEVPTSNYLSLEKSPPNVTDRVDGNRASHSAAPTSLPLTPSKPRWTKKLLLLISTQSIDRQVKVRQDLVQTALTAAGIDFECLDGSDTEESTIQLRNELFALSGLRGVYPQLFLVDLVPGGGGTTFWGTFTEFQHANDDGQLQTVFGNNVAANNLSNINTIPASSNSDSVPVTKRELQPANTSTTGVPYDVLESFSNQIKRIEENYQMERNETEQRHSIEMERLTSMYNACVQSKKELEERLKLEIKAKEDQLKEALQRNEGHRLKLDVLKREVSGTQELLQSRELEIKKLNEKHLQDLRAIEKHGVVAERKAEKLEEELQKVQNSLKITQGELNVLKDDHEKLIQRAKSIATELKDRRAECRHLESLVDQETQKNQVLQHTIDSLEERLNHQGMSQTEKDSEMDQLQAQLADAKLQMEQLEKMWREKEAKSELVLSEYKKRAQHSLSMANSRTASAVQAREEAELDARSARSTADAALERANKAEIASREAVNEAKTRVEAMTKERDAVVASLDLLKGEMRSIESKLANALQELENVKSIKEQKAVEVERLHKELDLAEAKTISTQQQLIESTNLVDTLREETNLLRDQLHHATVQAADAISPVERSNDHEYTDSMYKVSSMNGSNDDADDSTISALRLELSEANDAIEDLKTALKNALDQNEQKVEHESNNASAPRESIPLFYAMEKQAELKTARAEMNRLASVIADVQSEKMEAYEAMEEMRRKMEDAEARLKRFEKLGTLPTSESRGATEHDVNTAVNIEYLKHIMLRFMNAKSMTEKKTLVPVIAAVLELTPDEAQTAMNSIDHNSSTGVVGSKLFGFMS